MYYRMKPSYALRGWEGMSWVLVKRPENWTQILTQEQFQVLTLCDGETELPGGMLDKALQKALQECETKGWIEPCEKVCPLENDQY